MRWNIINVLSLPTTRKSLSVVSRSCSLQILKSSIGPLVFLQYKIINSPLLDLVVDKISTICTLICPECIEHEFGNAIHGGDETEFNANIKLVFGKIEKVISWRTRRVESRMPAGLFSDPGPLSERVIVPGRSLAATGSITQQISNLKRSLRKLLNCETAHTLNNYLYIYYRGR